MSELITSDSTFTERQKETLQFIVNMVIPALGELPGAVDQDILPGILELMGENIGFVEQTMSAIEAAANQIHGSEFAGLNNEDKEVVVSKFRSIEPELAKTLQVFVVSCYYKDPRVMRSLDLEARAPHPSGYAVEATDWSLLEPVRNMGKIYRTV
jgi:hypothetical protein